jgi:hypothetical protein
MTDVICRDDDKKCRDDDKNVSTRQIIDTKTNVVMTTKNNVVMTTKITRIVTSQEKIWKHSLAFFSFQEFKSERTNQPTGFPIIAFWKTTL